VDPRAGLDDMEKRKFLTLLGLKLQPQLSSPWPVAIPTMLSRLILISAALENIFGKVKIIFKENVHYIYKQ
jgi:hypothetical protein